MNAPFKPSANNLAADVRAGAGGGPLLSPAHVRLYAPIGHDAPKHSVEWANYQAARLAASEVYGKAVHCPIHRASLEAWQRGERSWPWPDATDEDRAVADHALLRALRMPDDEFDRVVSGQRRWDREFGR